MNAIRLNQSACWLGVLVAMGLSGAGCSAERQRFASQNAEQKTTDEKTTDEKTTDEKTADEKTTDEETKEQLAVKSEPANTSSQTELATFGCGCFWCIEAVFQQLEGVRKIESGYSGGHVENPTYEEVCNKRTGHAEVCQITFDPAEISFDELLEVFWKTHDPTTPNQQGYDIGPQYRSAIFYHTDQQRALSEKYKRELDSSGAFDGPIVTEITPFTKFYKAEDYHQNYFLQNPNDRYCRAIIQPKVEKFRKVFAAKVQKKD